MGTLYKSVQHMRELQRQFVIRRLLEMGIHEYEGTFVYDLDYYTLRHVLAMQKLKD